MLGTSAISVTRQRPRNGSSLCYLLKGFLRITFFGKLHVFSRLFWRDPSLALRGFSNTNFTPNENTSHICSDLSQESPRFPLFLTKRFTYWHKGTLVAIAKARSEKNTIDPKARNRFIFIANAMHKAKYGRALNEIGTAELRRQAAQRAGASEWSCCRLLCGLLFRFASYLSYAVLLICESFFVLYYLLDICVCLCWSIFLRRICLLDIYVQLSFTRYLCS